MSFPEEPFTRRRFLTSSLAAAAALRFARLACALEPAASSAACRLTAEQEVGPFYIAGEAIRSDISEGKPGIALFLRLVLQDSRTCAPLVGAAVDVWHCDALGGYSGYAAQADGGFGGRGGHDGPPHEGPPPGGGPPPAPKPTDKNTFLRGIQLTDADGAASFRTIFPGFYQGRTNHIHFKVRLGGRAGKSYKAGHTAHVGQVFFPEALAARLMAQAPYSRHRIHRTTQDEDGIFSGQDGAACIASIKELRAGKPEAGLRAELLAAVDPTATPAPVGGFGGPR